MPAENWKLCSLKKKIQYLILHYSLSIKNSRSCKVYHVDIDRQCTSIRIIGNSLYTCICVIFANTVVSDILIQVNINCIQSVLLRMIWLQVVYHEYLNLWYKWGFFPTCFYLAKKCHFQIFYVELRDVKISRGQTICCKIQDAYLKYVY